MTFTSDSQAQNQHRKFVCHFVRVGNLMLFLLVVVAVVLFEADDNNNIIIYNTNIYIIYMRVVFKTKMIQNCTVWLEVSLAVWSGYVQVCTVNSLFRHYPSKLSFETTCCYNMLVDIALQVHLRLISTKKNFHLAGVLSTAAPGDVSGHHTWPPKQLANNPFSTHWNQLELTWNSTFQHFHPTRPPLFHWNVEWHVFPWLGHAWHYWRLILWPKGGKVERHGATQTRLNRKFYVMEHIQKYQHYKHKHKSCWRTNVCSRVLHVYV